MQPTVCRINMVVPNRRTLLLNRISRYWKYKYEDIETVYFIKYLWSTILVIKKKDGERKNCSLALMDKKDIPVLIEELEQHGVDMD